MAWGAPDRVPNGFNARLRSRGAEGVVLSVGDGVAKRSLDASQADGRTLHADDTAARLRFSWGRWPADGSWLHSAMADDHLVQVARLCAGY